jgi:O-phosphoseryl-tRNA synthetase
MAIFDTNKIKAQARENFIPVWQATAELLPSEGEIHLGRNGKPHPVRDLIQESRQILLELGFDEVENPTILPDSDVVKQYGSEARVILDRVFYLAELPRPDIGLSRKKIAQIKEIAQIIDIEILQSILRAYKRGEVEADDLIEELVIKLKITDFQATELLNKVFPEFKKLQPIPTNRTLRSHMTATWYHTLAAYQDKVSFPLALFSIGHRYRNEQREDANHLRVHHSASIVIMDPQMSLQAGRNLASQILEKYGFTEVKFETKKATSKYYAPGQEEEVFIRHRGIWLEIADIGMYSPVSLANFDIKYPVFNAGFGIERMAKIIYGFDDIRKLVYPQFSVAEFSDEEIAHSISYIASPKTARGKRIAKAIEETARKHRDEIAPGEFVAWEDNLIRVTIVEEEAGKRLIGPAGFNEVCVANSEIYSDLSSSGVYTGINYLRAIAMGVAATLENNPDNLVHQVKLVRHLSDINLQLDEKIRKYMERRQRKIGVGGPVFITIKSASLANNRNPSIQI